MISFIITPPTAQPLTTGASPIYPSPQFPYIHFRPFCLTERWYLRKLDISGGVSLPPPHANPCYSGSTPCIKIARSGARSWLSGVVDAEPPLLRRLLSSSFAIPTTPDLFFWIEMGRVCRIQVHLPRPKWAVGKGDGRKGKTQMRKIQLIYSNIVIINNFINNNISLLNIKTS